MVAAIFLETGSSKIVARLVTIQVLLSNFTKLNSCFTISLLKNTHYIFHAKTILIFNEGMGKKIVNIFHLRLCCLLKGPKQPIRTKGIEPEIQGKTPYRGTASNLEHNGAPGSAPESLPNSEWCRNGV